METKITTKKMKVVGRQDYINADSGEIETMQVISYEERDFNFHKVWLGHVIQSLDLIGNKKIKFANFLLENMDYENKICMTMKQMSVNANISLDTISKTLSTLKQANFIKAINTGVYQINPEIIFKGGKNRRLNVLYKYGQRSPKETDSAQPTATEAAVKALPKG